MLDFSKSVKVFFIIVILFSAVSTVFSQSLTLTPKDTELLNQKEEKQGEEENIIIKTYKFHSKASKEEIIEFYRQMLSNEGFKESGQSAKDKRMMLFIKSNNMILLNFVPDYKDNTAIYYNIQLQEFPAATAAQQ